MRFYLKKLSAAVVATVIVSSLMCEPSSLHGQQSYELPPQEVVDIIDAKPEPSISFSPDRKWMLMLERPAMPSIQHVSRRMLRLAGMRIDPVANSPFSTGYFTGLALRARDSDQVVTVPIPDGSQLAGINWSHHSDRFAFITSNKQGQQLWVAEVGSANKPSMLTDRLTTVTGGPNWMPDGKNILCQLC